MMNALKQSPEIYARRLDEKKKEKKGNNCPSVSNNKQAKPSPKN